jgi:hypothetical protein
MIHPAPAGRRLAGAFEPDAPSPVNIFSKMPYNSARAIRLESLFGPFSGKGPSLRQVEVRFPGPVDSEIAKGAFLENIDGIDLGSNGFQDRCDHQWIGTCQHRLFQSRSGEVGNERDSIRDGGPMFPAGTGRLDEENVQGLFS